MIFVLDSNDRDRPEEAKGELHLMMQEPALEGVPLLVLCTVLLTIVTRHWVKKKKKKLS